MRVTTYSGVLKALQQASMPVREIGSVARVAVTPAAGRVIAMAFGPDEPNLLWSHPHLGNHKLVAENPGGLGGDRLWFSPELHYNWRGRPDWQSFSTYATPPEMDPGDYAIVDAGPESVVLEAHGELSVYGADDRVGFELTRTIRMIGPPLSTSDALMHEIDYVGIETSHVLHVTERTHRGLIDLWHLLQVPRGSVLVVPLNETATPQQRSVLSYGQPGGWVARSDHVEWRYTGAALAKMGLSAAALTGRSAVFHELAPQRWSMIVREFPVDPHARYCDHPYGIPRTDQAFQAWDGFGFGEMEFHSPTADAESGPRTLRQKDCLWIFAGRQQAIGRLGAHLLGVNVSHVFGGNPAKS